MNGLDPKAARGGTNDRPEEWARAASGLSFLYPLWIGQTIFGAIAYVAFPLLVRLEQSLGSSGLSRIFDVWSSVSLVIWMALGVGVVVGVGRFAAAPLRLQARGLTTAAFVLFLIHVALEPTSWMLGILQGKLHLGLDSDVWMGLHRGAWLLQSAVEGVALGLFATAMVRVGEGLARPLPAWGMGAIGAELLWLVGRPLYELAGARRGVHSENSYLLLSAVGLGLSIASNVAFVVWLGRLRGSIGSRSAATGASASTAGTYAPAWARAGDGLRLYLRATYAEIGIAVGGVVIALLATLSGSREVAGGFTLLGQLGGLAAGVVALVGLYRYTDVPVESGGRGAAGLGVVLRLVASLLGLYGAMLMLMVVGESSPSRRSADTMAQVFLVAGASWLLGLGGQLSLIASFRRVGRFLGASAVDERGGRVIGMLIATVVGAALLGAVAISGVLRGDGQLLVLFLLLGLVVLALATLVTYLGVVRDLCDSMPRRAAEIPAAASGTPT